MAVWVGYPDNVKPMLTEFGGQPVAGGTYPAMIFRSFMLAAMQIEKQRDAGKKGSTGETGVSVHDDRPGVESGGSTGGGDGATTSGDDETGDRRRTETDEPKPKTNPGRQPTSNAADPPRARATRRR